MKSTMPCDPVHSPIGAAVLLALGLLLVTPQVFAQDAEIEQLRATTQVLIDTLVESGVLSREKANQMMERSRALAKAKAEAQLKEQILQQVQQAQPSQNAVPSGPEYGKDGKKVVRVPYVPESVRKEIRDQVKQDVLAQARSERWADSAASPEWLNRFTFESDFRLREEFVSLAGDNTAPGVTNFMGGNYTRAADAVLNTSNGIPTANTRDGFDRLRLRARVVATAKVNDAVSATLGLSTGNAGVGTTTSSNNQTMGQYFNNYTAVVDKAYLRIRPMGDALTLMGGRMSNPFLATDLVWRDDLGFEGLTGSYNAPLSGNTMGTLTAGYFPLKESSPNASSGRSLIAIQAVADTPLGYNGNKLKFGAALYSYHGLTGEKEGTVVSVPDYAARYEYAAGFRQRGNTLFNVRGDGAATPTLGLASEFSVLNLTAVLDMPNLISLPIRFTGDAVQNLGFKRAEIEKRIGGALTDGKDYGFMARVQVGALQVTKAGQWSASLAYRYLGSDAVLDAFTNSDFGLGGTNNKGIVMGVNYGLYDNTALSARWMSSNPIDSFGSGTSPMTRLSVDTIQFELSSKF